MPRHGFTIIEKDEKKSKLDPSKEDIVVSDDLILYLWDSFKWIKFKWANGKCKKGLDYYGYTIMEEEEIKNLIPIIEKWIELFECAPEKFSLTGLYMCEENKYEKIKMKRKRVLNELCSFVQLCKKALETDKIIVHYGI